MRGDRRVFVAGHAGMVGSALVRRLSREPGVEVVTAPRQQLDLTEQAAVRTWFAEQSVEEVYLAAGMVGGIHANNTLPADFIYRNLLIEANVIDAAHRNGVQRMLFLGSSCIYPRLARQPITEDALLQGTLEATNEAYAVAKIAGIKLCESYSRQFGRDYRSVMPTNLYGPNDNFDIEQGHVLPSLLRRFYQARESGAKQVVIWGTGTPRREFLYVDDLAEACVHVMRIPHAQWKAATEPMLSHLNVGTGEDCSIRELAELIADVTGYAGRVVFDTTRPDGTPRKRLDVTRIRELGWRPSIGLRDGLERTYSWFVENLDRIRGR